MSGEEGEEEGKEPCEDLLLFRENFVPEPKDLLRENCLALKKECLGRRESVRQW